MDGLQKSRAHIELANEIYDGKLRKKQVSRRLDAMEASYEKPYFPYKPTRKDKPWDMAYLRNLCESITFGAGSREQFMYMAEVADEVYKCKRLLKSCIVVIVSVGAIVTGVLLLIQLRGKGL